MGTAVRRGSHQAGGPSTLTATCRMAGDAGSVRAARAVVQDLLAGEPSDVRDVAVLLADELVTNAVVHGGGRFSLAIEVGRDVVRVAVSDRSPDIPRVLHPSGEGEHGRGMAIIDALASAWGADRQRVDKVVWFELLLSR